MAVGRNSRTTTVQLGEKETAEAVVEMSGVDHDARIVVSKPDAERWVFGVDSSTASLLTTTAADDVLDQPEVPAWVETVLWEIGVAEVEA
jgi:hypothetical protein